MSSEFEFGGTKSQPEKSLASRDDGVVNTIILPHQLLPLSEALQFKRQDSCSFHLPPSYNFSGQPSIHNNISFIQRPRSHFIWANSHSNNSYS